jgi:hypothetical protein
MGRRKTHIGILWGKPHKERDHEEDKGVGRSIILKWILERYGGGGQEVA